MHVERWLLLSAICVCAVADFDSTCSLEATRKAPASCVLQAKSVRQSSAGVQPYTSVRDAMDSVASNWNAAGLGNDYVGMPNTFGPGDCVKLSRSEVGTCIISTDCGSSNIADVTFSFMCMNPGQVSTIHSFGKGGFDQQEIYDTEIICDSCVSIDNAFDTNSPLVKDTLKSMYFGSGASTAGGEGSWGAQGEWQQQVGGEGAAGAEGDASSGGGGIPDDGTGMADWKNRENSMNGSKWEDKGKGTWVDENAHWDGTKWVKSDNSPADEAEFRETSYFGPSSCISTFKGWRGTCIIKTQCKGMDMSNVEVGVTCLENDGSYKRYLFGRQFQPEETFDSLTECVTCTGIGANPGGARGAPVGPIPKQLVDEVNMLKHQVRDLKTTLVDYMGDEGDLAGTSLNNMDGAGMNGEGADTLGADGMGGDANGGAGDGTGENININGGTSDGSSSTNDQTNVNINMEDENNMNNINNMNENEITVTAAPPAPAPTAGTPAPQVNPITKKPFSQQGFVSSWVAGNEIPEEELAPAPKMIAAPASGSHKFVFMSHDASSSSSGQQDEAGSDLVAAGSDKRPHHELKDLLRELAAEED
mmetsp:Transcript_10851/g.24880  ORF Transcript_10851/g.24880 Transcript_10851/m.24880 type:complete len:589 (+) Transcript_10851:137-1903(+)